MLGRVIDQGEMGEGYGEHGVMLMALDDGSGLFLVERRSPKSLTEMTEITFGLFFRYLSVFFGDDRKQTEIDRNSETANTAQDHCSSTSRIMRVKQDRCTGRNRA